ncbi:hypothetical protein GCM10009117_15610 [Gangjinia marincola]|uniref:Outer membrane protein assembly factor n=1 Tax=Gangjinia marincola TaxID=578463 RepID=A0ABN1MGY2_9FLAO
MFTLPSFGQERIQDSKVDSFAFIGSKRMSQDFLARMVRMKKGVQLDSAVIQKDMILLRRLTGVAHSTFQIVAAPTGETHLFYTIKENFTLIPQANTWTVNDDEIAYRAGLYEYNLLGRNITFGGFYQNNGFDSYGLNVNAPYLFSRSFGFAINYLDWTSQEPLFFEEGTTQYIYNNRSIELLGVYEHQLYHNFRFGFNLFNEEYTFKEGFNTDEIPQQLSLDKFMLKSVYTYDKRDYEYYFVSGFQNILNLQYVDTVEGEQPDFLIGWNDFLYYKRIGERGNWANRLRFGIATNDESPLAPFSLDNNLNIRGVGNIIDRGTASLVLNTEYRYTLFKKNWFVLQGNAFVDTGTWRNPGGELSDFWDPENMRLFPGLGLRLIHKHIFNAIFRIDYGYGVGEKDNSGIVFGVGQYF